MKCMLFLGLLVLTAIFSTCHGTIPRETLTVINKINNHGPYLGLVVPNVFEMGPLLQSPGFVENRRLPYFDFGGRRFRLRWVLFFNHPALSRTGGFPTSTSEEEDSGLEV